MKFRKNDEVLIIAGKDKGKRGKIEAVLTKTHKVMVPGVNQYKKHVKKKDEKNPGGIIDLPKPLPVSNISLICPKCKKVTRVGYLVTEKDKQRICRKCKQLI